MPFANSTPLKFSPSTVCDALDSGDVPSGAMAALTNLIPDPTTRNVFQCRPASARKTVFDIFTMPGFVSCYEILGNQVYGMIATARNAGRDEPFCYDLIAGTFTLVGGTINSTTTPASPAATGAWVPPSMSLVGTKLVVCHPGFNGTGGVYFGWFDVSDPTAPTWNAGNLSGAITFSTAPSVVVQFNQRAHYIVNPPTGQPSLVFSDTLDAVTATNATQVLTFGDNVRLTAAGGLPLQNQLGGIIQSLIVFKGVSNIFQVTGNYNAVAANSTLAVNSMNIVTGTLAPNTVCPTPKGLAFVSPDGVRIIDFYGTISDPIGIAGDGVTVPFTYSVTPSRMCASCGGNVLRVSTTNGLALGAPNEEYWYDFARKIWTGPHTFAASLIKPWSNTFIKTPLGVVAALFQSDVVQSSTSTYVENSNALTYTYRTSFLPDTDRMAQNAMQETTIYMALPAGGSDVSVTAADQNGTIFDTVEITPAAPTLWGQFLWGQALWQGQASALAPRPVHWTQPIVFQRVNLAVSGSSADGFKIGRAHMRYEELGYLIQESAA